MEQVISNLKNVIEKFKNRTDVVDGNAIGWKPRGEYLSIFDRPTNVGSGLTTTGWCVTASETLLNDVGFQSFLQVHGSYAKLVSIDIKEQYYGHCYNGTQNKWHTAVLLSVPNSDGINVNLIVDLTCGQFGDAYVGKDIWTVQAWMNKFRSKLCKHVILDRENNELSVAPVSAHVSNVNENMTMKYSMLNQISLDSVDRNKLLNFFNNFGLYNNKILLGTIKPEELDFISDVVKLYDEKINEVFSINKGYTSILFQNKESAFNWLDNMLELVKNDRLTDFNFTLKQNMMVFETIENAKKHFDIVAGKAEGKYILNIEFNKVQAVRGFSEIKSYVLFVGTEMNFKLEKDLFKKQTENECLISFNGI